MKRDFGPYHHLTFRYHTDLLEFWGNAGRRWLTHKAKVEELLKIIPRKLRIERFVFKKEDRVGIEKALGEALRKGYWPGLRSCYLYQPLGKAPWIMAIKKRRAIRLFFRKRRENEIQPWCGTPNHYHEWLADPGLKEVIVMFNPARLCPSLAKEHLVARVEIFEGHLRLEMRLHTDQLREMENDVARSDLISLQMHLKDNFRFERRPVLASFGHQHHRAKRMQVIFPSKDKRLRKLIKPESLRLTRQVAEIVFHQWCDAPFNLFYRLQALREFGLEILELQGKIKADQLEYLLAYGLRGKRDVSWSRNDLNRIG